MDKICWSLKETYKTKRTNTKKGTVLEEELNNIVDEDIDELFNNFNIDYEFNRLVHEHFFNFNANLLANYSKYLNLDFY